MSVAPNLPKDEERLPDRSCWLPSLRFLMVYYWIADDYDLVFGMVGGKIIYLVERILLFLGLGI